MSAESPATPRPLGEISQEPASFERFLDRNQKYLVLLGGVIAIGAAAYIIMHSVKSSHEHTAGAALTQADDLSSLQKIVTDYPKTAAGGSARILLAETQWTEGQQDASIATLKAFLAEDKNHPAIGTAQASLGSKLAAQGKADEASKVFEDLAASDSARYLTPFALLSLGDIAKAAGDLTKAESYYQRAQNEFPESTFATTATRRILLIKSKAPAEIEAPPAAPQPAPTEGLAPTPLTPIPAPAAPESGTAPAPQPPSGAPAPTPAEPAPAPIPQP